MGSVFLGLGYLSILFSNSIILANVNFSLLLSKIHLCYVYHNFIIHASADGPVGWLHAMVTRAVIDSEHVSLQEYKILLNILPGGIAGSYGSFNLLFENL